MVLILLLFFEFINGTQHGCSKINTVRRKDGSIFALVSQRLEVFFKFLIHVKYFFNTKQILFLLNVEQINDMSSLGNQCQSHTESGPTIFDHLGMVLRERAA